MNLFDPGDFAWTSGEAAPAPTSQAGYAGWQSVATTCSGWLLWMVGR